MRFIDRVDKVKEKAPAVEAIVAIRDENGQRKMVTALVRRARVVGATSAQDATERFANTLNMPRSILGLAPPWLLGHTDRIHTCT